MTNEMTPVTPWGVELMLNVAGCNAEAISSKETIESFVKELVPAIDMTAFGEPWIVRFGSGNKLGYTLVQLIETSNITAHFVEEDNTAYFNVFSCKPFNPQIVVDLVNKYFAPETVHGGMLERDARKLPQQ